MQREQGWSRGLDSAVRRLSIEVMPRWMMRGLVSLHIESRRSAIVDDAGVWTMTPLRPVIVHHHHLKNGKCRIGSINDDPPTNTVGWRVDEHAVFSPARDRGDFFMLRLMGRFDIVCDSSPWVAFV
jgi:hypothetical protein